MTWLRSALFNLLFYGVTAIIAVGSLVLLPLPRPAMRGLLRGYAWIVLALLRVVCGIRLKVTGAEHLPVGGPALIAANHQSALDTMVWLWLLPDAAYVLKKELLSIPVWGRLASKARMIAVDRNAGASAMRHLLKEGKVALAAGRQIVIFPEGTRVAPGERVAYQPGVAALAASSRLPVIPVATDSGLHWGRRAFGKQPGVVTVALLPPLPPDLGRVELLRRLAETIEGATDALLEAGRARGEA